MAYILPGNNIATGYNIIHIYRSSEQTSSIHLQTIPTRPTHSEPKCPTDKSVKTIEQCETDDTYEDTIAVGTENIYESLPDLQQSFNNISSSSHSLKEKSECCDDDYVDVMNGRMENEYSSLSGQYM